MFDARLENIGLLSVDGKNNLVLLKPNSIGQKYIFDNRLNNNRSLNAPIYIDLYPSFICNYNCNFCYNKYLNNCSEKIMSKKVVNKIIEYCANKKILGLNIVGGEPYHPQNIDITKYIVKKASTIGLKANITTNLSYVNKSIVTFCKKYDVKFNASFISTDKNIGEKVSGSKKYLAQEIIDKYIDKNIAYGLSTPILKINAKDIFQTANYLNTLTGCAWVLRYVTVPKTYNLNLSLTEFYKISKKVIAKTNKKVYFDAPFSYKYFNIAPPQNKLDFLYCGCKAGFLKVEFMPNGDVYPCIMLKKVGKIGNILINDDFILQDHRKVNCKNINCKYNVFCTGCPGYAFLNKINCDNRCGDFCGN